MKYILLLIFLTFYTRCQSTYDNPNRINSDIVIAPKSPLFTIVQYFSLEQIQENLVNQQWYAFLTLKASQKKFWMKIHVYLSTVSKITGMESPSQIECFTDHNDLHDCYFSHKLINTKEEILKVEMVFQEETVLEIKIEINAIHNLQIGEEVTLHRTSPNFTRLLRMDIREYEQKFDFLFFELAQQFIVDEFKNAMTFLVSLEQTPPDDYRFNSYSYPFWDNRQMLLYSYEQLQEVQYITILIGITDLNTYKFRNKIITQTKEIQKIQPNRQYYQVVSKQKSYRMDLSARGNNSYYLFQLKIDTNWPFEVINTKINNNPVSKRQLEMLLLQNGATKSKSQIDLWLNASITSFEFTLVFEVGSIFSLYLSEFDLNLLNLPQKLIWGDDLSPNETQLLYFVIDTKSSDQSINLQVETTFDTNDYVINFRNCVQKTIQECREIATSNNETKRSIGMPIIKPVKQNRKSIVVFKFGNYSFTKHQIQSYVYRSIVVVQITAFKQLNYGLNWHLVNPLQIIKDNELVQGTLESNQVRTFCFTVLDASSFAFARVHFLHGTTASSIFGSTELIDPQLPPNTTDSIIFEFDGSITFTELANKTTYYVYIVSSVKDVFELTLTYGRNLDDQLNHPISYLTLGEHTTNQLILQPLEILFLEIRSEHVGTLVVENNLPLKICMIPQKEKPTSHKDMNSEFCDTFSTVNRFFTYNFQNTGKWYVGIENENSSPSSVSLVTQDSSLTCPLAEMGRTRYMHAVIRNDTNKTDEVLCISYVLSRKGEIEVLVDLNNPKLQGIAHPSVKIGEKWQTIMTTNLLLITEEDVDIYCEQNYEHCLLKIQIKRTQNYQINQQYIALTASYTDQPLVLKDGLAHHTNIKANEIKYFKYAIYSNQNISITLQTKFYHDIIAFAKIITSDEKFVYPEQEDYSENSTEVYASVNDGYFYPITLTIPSADIKSKNCIGSTTFCYALISVDSKSTDRDESFLIQLTQTINTLTSGNRLEKYIEKDSKAYFNFNNNQAQSLLFFTTSNIKDCIKIAVYEGNNGPKSKYDISSNQQEVIISNAKKGWYTAAVLAHQSCYFTIQVTASKKVIRQLTFGYANYFAFEAKEKKYYLVHNQNLDHIKIIASLTQQNSGQLILQAMPVTDSQLSDFTKLINGQQEVNKKSKLEFVWTGINHLSLRHSDPKFCKECYIYIQAEATTFMNGYLSIPTSNEYSLHLSSYISYDILLQGQTFTWLYNSDGSDVFVAIQAGELQVIVESSQKAEVKRSTLKYNKIDSEKNILKISDLTARQFETFKIKIKALQNTDYSIYSNSNIDSAKNKSNFIEIGRPNYVYFYNKGHLCYQGQLSNEASEFILTNTLEKDFEKLKKSLQITGFIEDKQVTLVNEETPNVILFHFDTKVSTPKTNFKICFEHKTTQVFTGTFMYLGNLNYFPENSVVHVKKSMNLTFMSEGAGIIEVDECASRSTISINSQYKDIKSANSKINSRRGINNLISFTYSGSIYMHVDSSDYVALRWKNYHPSSHNGFGYDIYSPSTFRINYEQATQDISLKIKPLEQVQEANILPQFLEVNYKVYVSGEELDLYNAMNCQKGKYMYWVKHVNDPQQVHKEATVKLNNIADLKSLFKTKEYVLIVVKAQVVMKWALNNYTQSYRFYYPYQELILSQFHDDLTKEDEASVSEPESGVNITAVIFAIAAVIIAVLLTIFALKWLRRKYWRGAFFTQEESDRSDARQNGTELETKIQSSSQNATK